MRIKVLVIGDVMLDAYHYGRTDRISPEAPIPVFKQEKVEYFLGGAANLASNLSGLGCEVSLWCPYYDEQDMNYMIFNSLLKMKKISKIKTESFCNDFPIKHRFVDLRNKTQVGLRWDLEGNSFYNSLSNKDFKIDYFVETNAVIFSDYCKKTLDDKEFIRNIMDVCDENNINTFLDSRRDDLSLFYTEPGVIDYFKPNLKEYDKYIKQRKDILFPKILRTESESGMTLLEDNKNYDEPKIKFHIDATSEGIVDPTGAGDTALAAFVYGITAGINIYKSVEFSNYLSGISCSHKRTYSVNKNDVEEACKKLEIKL